MDLTILDGAMGTLLEADAPLPLPAWTAHAVRYSPAAVRNAHAAYVRAGAHVHTACTFRTTPRAIGDQWRLLAQRAVNLAREAGAVRIAGSIAPLADCYHPDLSPARHDPDAAASEHALTAAVLAQAGCDLLLCETHSCMPEALGALAGARRTGLPVWVSFTPGPDLSLMSPAQMRAAADQAAGAGAAAVLVNCAPAGAMIEFVRACAAGVNGRIPIGAYANAKTGEGIVEPAKYAQYARAWIDAGATIIGGCCYTAPAHIAAIARLCEEIT